MFNRATEAIMRASDKIPGIDLSSDAVIQTACSCRRMQSHGKLAADVINKTLLLNLDSKYDNCMRFCLIQF